MNCPEHQNRLKLASIAPATPISEAIAQLDKAGTGALMLCEQDGRLCGLLTDGDLRRAILQGRSLDHPASSIATCHPIVASMPISPVQALKCMNSHDINHLPVLDSNGCVQLLLLRRDLIAEEDLHVSAVIMAGGLGTRLRPLTDSTPKPMLHVGDRPLLELTISRLRSAGIREVNLTTHYLPDAIVSHFGDGGGFGVSMNYVREDSPLGTAGGIRLIKRPNGTLLVMNGDILTKLPFRELVAYHRRQVADLTVAVRKYDLQVPFGVVRCEGARVTSLEEKPNMSFFINAGAYLVEPSLCELIPPDRRFDMTDLIQAALLNGRKVIGFPIVEYWLDIGRHEDYEQAQQDALNGRLS